MQDCLWFSANLGCKCNGASVDRVKQLPPKSVFCVCTLKGQQRAIVNQMNIGTVPKATLPLGKLLRDRVECIIMGFSEHIDYYISS